MFPDNIEIAFPHDLKVSPIPKAFFIFTVRFLSMVVLNYKPHENRVECIIFTTVFEVPGMAPGTEIFNQYL